MANPWNGDWRARVNLRICERGYSSVTEFAVAHPHMTFKELVNELGDHTIEPVQVQWVLCEAARARNDLRWFAKDCLAREIRDNFPTGWRPRSALFRMSAVCAYTDWLSAFNPKHYPAGERAWNWLLAQDIPEGWLPEGADDPWIEAMFQETGFLSELRPDRPPNH